MVEIKADKSKYLAYSRRMVEEQIEARGVRDKKLLKVMEEIPRHEFVIGFSMGQAYGDFPLPIGYAQTISQPYMVAYMTELLELEGDEKVLEIGTGSGYQAGILASLVKEVYTVETIGPLSIRARGTLEHLGFDNIHFLHSDGSVGWKEHAPYDRIIVTAAVPEMPESLKKQLADDGILLAPVGNYLTYQVLEIIRRKGEGFYKQEDIKCRFVPLIGKFGFQ